MPWFIKFDDQADLEALRSFVAIRLHYYKQNLGGYIEQVVLFERLANCLEEARYAERVTLLGEADVEPPKAKEPKIRKEKEAPPKLCSTHPYYQAKRRPRTECPSCWTLYEKYNGAATARSARAKFDRMNHDRGDTSSTG